MKRNITLLGGDLRISTLAKMLADDENKVYVFGMEKSNEIMKNDKLIKCDNIDEAISKSDIIIGSVPFLKGDNEMYATFSDNHILIKDLMKKRYKGKTFIAGSIPVIEKNELYKSYENVVDLMEREELVILNTIATAEGAIEVAMKNTDKVLHGSKVLILGFGRVGKVVAKKFMALSAKVTCAARRKTDLAWIKAFGYEPIDINNINEEFGEFDIIINTVPQMIIDKNKLKYMNKNVLLIDLASNPGGINRDDAKELNLKLVWALALPGKVAPVTSAEFMKQSIYNVLDEI